MTGPARLSCRSGIARSGASRSGAVLSGQDRYEDFREEGTTRTNPWQRTSSVASGNDSEVSSSWTVET